MVAHMVALATLKLVRANHGVSSSFVNSLVWPFVLKLPLSRIVGISYTELAASVTLFAFRLGRIIFDDTGSAGNRQRWERALRLVCERVIAAQNSSTRQAQEGTLYSASMFAL